MGDDYLTYAEFRGRLDAESDEVGDWQGIPIPLGWPRLRLQDRHPLADACHDMDLTLVERDLDEEAVVHECKNTDVRDDEIVVNHWFNHKLNCTVWVLRKGPEGRASVVKEPRSPDGSMDRLTFWLSTIGACDAWTLEAERRAREKLRGLLNEQQWRQYELCGAFCEASHRSDLIYVFRRLRPTVALTPRWPWFRKGSDKVRMLAVLCLHPVGYYDQTWAGCMVPSDDVIAHLLFMRADEAGFWRQANQHEAWTPEAGL